MSENSPSPDPDRPDLGRQSTGVGRRRERVLIPGVVIAVTLGIFAVLLLVTGSAAVRTT